MIGIYLECPRCGHGELLPWYTLKVYCPFCHIPRVEVKVEK